MQSQSCLVSPLESLSGAKILIDARKIAGGGIGVYIRNLVSGLLAFSKAEITIIVSDKNKVDPKWNLNVIEDKTKLNSIDEMFNFNKRIEISKYDLFHSPHYVFPYKISIPSVVTVHDIIHITNPEKFYYPYLSKLLIKSAIKRASAVLTVSNSSRNDLIKLFPKFKDKINVVRNAINNEFLNTNDLPSLSKFQLNDKFLLGVFSNVKPHKRLKDLLDAFCNIHSDYQLVLVGLGIESLVDDNQLLEIACTNKVKLLGRLDTRELVALYAKAKGVVIPTLAEGFCLPIIEAHSQNTPVVVRPVPACLELVCSSDIICEDNSIDSLEKAILKLIQKEKTALDLSSSIQELNLYSITEQIAQVYKNIL